MKYKLNIEKEFTDKNTGKLYKVGDVVTFNEERATELLSDTRELVSLNEKIEDKKSNKDKSDKNK